MSDIAKRALDYLAISQSVCPEEFLGSRSGKIVVCGSGHTLWDDLEKVGFIPTEWKQNFDLMAVNRTVMDIPSSIDFGYSNHSDMMLRWAQARDEAYTQKDNGHSLTLHSNRPYAKTHVWPVPGAGTSGLNAVLLAILLGYDEIKVCGIPMDNGPHYYDAPWFVWNHFEGPKFGQEMADKGVEHAANNNGIMRPWFKMFQRFSDIVEPMSGNPREMWKYLSHV